MQEKIKYEYLMHKVINIKGLKKAFKLVFDVFTANAKNMTCLEPVYENGLNQKGWNISHKNINDTSGITTFVCLKLIKPIKKQVSKW